MKDIEKSVVADDITEIRLLDAQCHWNAGYNDFTFSCKIKGEDDILYMTESRHDDGDGVTINSEKDDIWERMTSGELFKLDDKLRVEIEYDTYHKEIEKAATVEECNNIVYEFMENENYHFKQALPRLWKELDAKEKKLAEPEKPSVLKQLREDKSEHAAKQKSRAAREEAVR